MKRELAALEGDGRREIAERIKTAREWGDLKENSEYHDAKNDQAHLETKIARLREKISDAVVVEEAPQGAGGVVGFGSTVVVRDQDGVEQTWRIVSSHDASPREGRLSAESPVAVALLGRAPGEQAAVSLPKGTRAARRWTEVACRVAAGCAIAPAGTATAARAHASYELLRLRAVQPPALAQRALSQHSPAPCDRLQQQLACAPAARATLARGAARCAPARRRCGEDGEVVVLAEHFAELVGAAAELAQALLGSRGRFEDFDRVAQVLDAFSPLGAW